MLFIPDTLGGAVMLTQFFSVGLGFSVLKAGESLTVADHACTVALVFFPFLWDDTQDWSFYQA